METHIAALPHHARGRALDYAVWPGWRVLMEDAGSSRDCASACPASIALPGSLDAVRDALAHHYLGSTAMAAAEISFLLGFEDANSFARAFQGRAGHTPQTLRNRLREAAATSAASVRSQ